MLNFEIRYTKALVILCILAVIFIFHYWVIICLAYRI